MTQFIDDTDDYYEGVCIQKATLSYRHDSFHLWFLKSNALYGEEKDLLRRLRICLLKLNNYREGLEGVFGHLKQTEEDDFSELLHIKFSQMLNLLQRDRYFGVDGKDIMDDVVTRESTLYYQSWAENIHMLKYYISKIENAKTQKLQYAGGIKMGDTYNIQQAGNVGPQAGANSTVTQVINNTANGVEYEKIMIEIEMLKKHLRAEASSDDNDILIGELTHLNKALEKKDEKKAVSVLKTCGAQLLDIAKRIGCSLAAAYISGQLGL